MFVKRNDQCPCGSGKKYKKCCLKRVTNSNSLELKEERITQQRKVMLARINEFLARELSLVEYARIVKQFKLKTDNQITATNFIQFWLSFCYRFEDGNTGLQYFLKKNKERLTESEKNLVESWIALKPSIFQVIQKSEKNILLEDISTKVEYAICTTEELSVRVLPWCGVIGFIEKVGDKYNLLGEPIILDPTQLDQAIQKVRVLNTEDNGTYQDTLKEKYLEVLSAVFCKKSETIKKQRDIEQYTLLYKVLDGSFVEHFFNGNSEFKKEEWGPLVKQVNWVGNKKVYSDNLVSGNAYIQDVLGQIKINETLLQFTCYDIGLLESFKSRIRGLGSTVILIENRINSFMIPYSADFNNITISLDEPIPPYFYEYVKQSMELDLDRPQPYFNGLTIRNLVDEGKHEFVDLWLKQCEYNLYHTTLTKYNDFQITADFNSIRRSLGLRLSKFVTGGNNRISTILSFDTEPSTELKKIQEDKNYYDDLGFTNEHIDLFFTKDFVEFYKEKTKDKSENTIRKYRLSLIDLKDLFLNKKFSGWKSISPNCWKSLLTVDYYQMCSAPTKTQVKDFHSTIKAFSKWLDLKYDLASSQAVTQIVKEQEECILV